MPELSDDELDALVEEATVDAYGDDEQLDGFAVMITRCLREHQARSAPNCRPSSPDWIGLPGQDIAR